MSHSWRFSVIVTGAGRDTSMRGTTWATVRGGWSFQRTSIAAGQVSPTSSRNTLMATDGGDHSSPTSPKATNQTVERTMRSNAMNMVLTTVWPKESDQMT